VNSFIDQFAGPALQTSQVRNVTIHGGHKYNVPSGNFTIDESLLDEIGAIPSLNLASYTQPAIVGADDFNDGNTTMRDVFDAIIENTREVTPTCGSLMIHSHLFMVLDCPQSSRDCLEYVQE